MTDAQPLRTARAAAGSPTRRTLARIRALTMAELPAEQLAVLLLCEIGRTIGTETFPALYVLDSSDQQLQDFTVWIGTETLTAEMRMLLAAGMWPGPDHAPSPARIARDRSIDPFVAVTMWGEHSDGPWAPMWRERNVKHGFYGAFASDGGRVGVMLAHRGNDVEPFTVEDTAFVRACAPYVSACLDRTGAVADDDWQPVETVHIRFDAEGRIAAISFGGTEMLRDVGGGGPQANSLGREIVENGIAPFRASMALPPLKTALSIVGGTPDERSFRETQADLSIVTRGGRGRRTLPVLLKLSGLGRFELWPSAMIGLSGDVEIGASLTRHVPSLLLRLRRALHVSASAREIQLICALATGGSLSAAADRLSIAEGTARTLAKRLAQRCGTGGLTATMIELAQIGRMLWP